MSFNQNRGSTGLGSQHENFGKGHNQQVNSTQGQAYNKGSLPPKGD